VGGQPGHVFLPLCCHTSVVLDHHNNESGKPTRLVLRRSARFGMSSLSAHVTHLIHALLTHYRPTPNPDNLQHKTTLATHRPPRTKANTYEKSLAANLASSR
jgi:hypothetical protein